MRFEKAGYLVQIEAIIGALTSPTASQRPRGELVEAMRKLDDIVTNHGAEMPKDLLHYLQRRSYEKALNFLQSR